MTLEQPNFSQFKGDSSAGAHLPNKLQQEATEHTLGGKVIGAVRDFIPGCSGSAQSNDQIAHIAADTIAALPTVKTFAGGAIRASILIDPTRGFADNVSGFGLNFAEGALLNRVSRLAMPDSAFAKFTSARLGGGLAAEAATHLSVGLGFGAIRTGFNPDSWKDQSGAFSVAAGAENLIKGGATGALINLPAGFIGFRVAKASSVMLANGALSPRLASVLTGVGSGYAAGGVFGGLDAVMSGKSLTDVLKSANEGGIIGAVSGGAMGAFDGSHSFSAVRNRNQSVDKFVDRFPLQTEKFAPGQQKEVSTRHQETPTNWRASEFDHATMDAISIKRLEMPRITEVAQRLSEPIVRPEEYRYLDPKAKGPYKDFEEFATNFRIGVRDVRVYNVEGHTAQIAVPEEYARQLDAVRKIRVVAERPSILDDLTPVQLRKVQGWVKANDTKNFHDFYSEVERKQVLPILSARNGLEAHPLGLRALPEDIATLMDELPTRTNLKVVQLLDEPNYQDAWHQQTYKNDFSAAATASESTGVMTFYKADRLDAQFSKYRDILRGYVLHEHSHLAPPRTNYYEEASLLEKDGYQITEYSKRNDEERWAEDRSKGFLSPHVDRFLELAEKAPLRTVIIASELANQMKAVPDTQHSVYAEQFKNRIKFTEEHVLPIARAQLTDHLLHGDLRSQEAAVRLLTTLGNKDHIEPLLKVAQATSSVDLARKAFDLASQLHSPDHNEQFNFAFEHAQPGDPLRSLAIRRIRQLGSADERGASYANLLEIVGDKDLPGLSDQIFRMTGDEGKTLAYDYAMNLGRDVVGYQKAVALRVLHIEPSLRVRAINTLAHLRPDGLAPVIHDYVNDADPNVSAAAREALKAVQGKSIVNGVQDKLGKGKSLSASDLHDLGRADVNEAIMPLLETAVKGPAQSRQAALDQLSNYSPALVKFYGRELRRNLTRDQIRNLDLVMNH